MHSSIRLSLIKEIDNIAPGEFYVPDTRIRTTGHEKDGYLLLVERESLCDDSLI